MIDQAPGACSQGSSHAVPTPLRWNNGRSLRPRAYSELPFNKIQRRLMRFGCIRRPCAPCDAICMQSASQRIRRSGRRSTSVPPTARRARASPRPR
ncbi:unnamed protein product, partial [Iphiclides podalirius]